MSEIRQLILSLHLHLVVSREIHIALVDRKLKTRAQLCERTDAHARTHVHKHDTCEPPQSTDTSENHTSVK